MRRKRLFAIRMCGVPLVAAAVVWRRDRSESDLPLRPPRSHAHLPIGRPSGRWVGWHSGSDLWESRRRILRLDERLCRLDNGYSGRGHRVVILGYDVNHNGTILAMLAEVGRPDCHTVLLEPLE